MEMQAWDPEGLQSLESFYHAAGHRPANAAAAAGALLCPNTYSGSADREMLSMHEG